MENNCGRQIGSAHAGRSDRRASADDCERARRSAERWWFATKAAWKEAYCKAHDSALEKHAAEVRVALALAGYKGACKRLRSCQALYGAAPREA